MAAEGKVRRRFKWHNFWVCFVISMGQMAFGYPSSIIGEVLGQPAFLLYMGLINEKGEIIGNGNGLIGATSGVFQAGAFFGVLGGSYIIDRYGRKAGFIYCSILSILGGTLLCASQNIGMFIAFRFFAGAGSWGFLAATPVYSAELAPYDLRGFFVGLNGVFITLGYFIAGAMGLAFDYSHSPTAKWRAPLGIALIFPIFMLFSLLWLPESPRYLLMKGRVDEAWEIVSRIHSDPDDPDDEFARGEFYQMQKQIEFDRTLAVSWKDMFFKKSYRARTSLAMILAFIGQSTAVLVINNYGPTFYKALGFNSRQQLILECGWLAVGIPGNLLGAAIMDYTGRRPLILTGVIGCCCCLIVEAAIVASFASTPEQAANPNHAALGVGVAAFYCFLMVYSVGIDVAGVVFYSELFPNHLRPKGVALAIATIALTDLVYLQATTTAFANIGWRFFLVFICVTGVGAVYVWMMIPETKGIPLEEMAAIFGDTDEVVVYLKDVHVDRNTHQLVVDTHTKGSDGEEMEKVVTEAQMRERKKGEENGTAKKTEEEV